MIGPLVLLAIGCCAVGLIDSTSVASIDPNHASGETLFKSVEQRLQQLEERVKEEKEEWEQERQRWDEERKEWLRFKQEAMDILQTLQSPKSNAVKSAKIPAGKKNSQDKNKRDATSDALAASGTTDFNDLMIVLNDVLKQIPTIEQKVDSLKTDTDSTTETLNSRLGAVEGTVQDHRGSLDLLRSDLNLSQIMTTNLATIMADIKQSNAALTAKTNDLLMSANGSIAQLAQQLLEQEHNLTDYVDHEINAAYQRQYTLQQKVKIALNAVNGSVFEQVENLYADLVFTARNLFLTGDAVQAMANKTDTALRDMEDAMKSEVAALQQEFASLVLSVVRNTQSVQDHEYKTLTDMRAIRDQLETHMETLHNQVTASLQAVLTQVDIKMMQLEHHDSRASSGQESTARSAFVHWGSSVCPQSTELVFSGAAGSGFHPDSGASGSVLCLPANPVLKDLPVLPAEHTELQGAEFSANLQSYHDVVCAVCRSPHPTTITIPAADTCAAGWTLQYKGFLMAGKQGQDYVCVESSLEGPAHGSDVISKEGLVLFYTFVRCGGSLPCSVYPEGKAVTCVVCSK